MVAVIIPVYNAPQQFQRCVFALQDTLPPTDVKVIVIDDASSDPHIDVVCNALPKGWILVKNRSNLGFVGTVNLGLALASPNDVVILNSDTQVTRGWLDEILNCAQSNERFASVTPLTNNGEIASVPTFCCPNAWPESPELWAEACVNSGPPLYPLIPTAVGFCMFMRRACLDEIGGFDEVLFGRGYGEENDWCCRASDVGWLHGLCDQAFVAHEGGASFGPLGISADNISMQRLLSKHPDYLDRIQEFVEVDLMATRRQQICDYLHGVLIESSSKTHSD